MNFFLFIPLVLLNGSKDYIEIKFNTLKECKEYSSVISHDLKIKKPICHRIKK
jgi:hypothetical protein